MKMKYLVFIAGLTVLFGGCSPEVGSDKWCAAMKEKNKEDWTVREIKDFTEHCLFK
jgi:hypothetical protein